MVYDQPTPVTIPIDKAEPCRTDDRFALAILGKGVGPGVDGSVSFPMGALSTRVAESQNEKTNLRPASVHVVGFRLMPLKAGTRTSVSVFISNDTGNKVMMKNSYSMSLVPSVPNKVNDRRTFEARLWTGFDELQKTLIPEALEVPPSVRGTALLSENDEGPVATQEFLDKFWGRGGAVYILGTIKVDGEQPITYCAFATVAGREFARCLEHN